MIVLFKQLTEGAKAPRKNKPSDAGFDLHAVGEFILEPSGRVVVPTGFACQPPTGYAGFIWPRSGLAANDGIDVLGGLVDQGYRGEVRVVLVNHGSKQIQIKDGDRVAQIVFSAYLTESALVDTLDESDRGALGFGSSGIK